MLLDQLRSRCRSNQ